MPSREGWTYPLVCAILMQSSRHYGLKGALVISVHLAAYQNSQVLFCNAAIQSVSPQPTVTKISHVFCDLFWSCVFDTFSFNFKRFLLTHISLAEVSLKNLAILEEKKKSAELAYLPYTKSTRTGSQPLGWCWKTAGKNDCVESWSTKAFFCGCGSLMRWQLK